MKRYLLLSFFISAYLSLSAQPIPDITAVPKVAWQLQFKKAFYGSAVIKDDVVYAGCTDSNFYAIDAGTGKIKWKFKTGGDIRSTPAIADGRIFFTSGDGVLYCLNEKGALIWRFASNGDKKYPLYSFADYWQSSPVVDDTRIYFGSGDHFVYAIDAATGQVIWKYQTGDVVHATPAISGNRLFIGSFDGYFYALNKLSGTLLWKFKSVGHRYFPKGEMQASAAVLDHLVFTGGRDYNFYALNDSLGYSEWNRSFEKGWAMTKPIFKDGVVYEGTSDDHLLLAYKPNGSLIWKADLKFNIFGSPAFSDGKLYVGTLMGRLYAIDQKAGRIDWSINSAGFEQYRADYFKPDESYRDDIAQILGKPEQYIDALQKLGAIFSQPAITADYLIITTVGGQIICYHHG